ncbi:hypothetical protein R5R35_014664 [Gryllus longicercus]|uniref:Solute carrier family 3 member 2 N-terminal domain-containing protein n=1 Tax=Gryllus longicercus TaxID=2509291 RepID=A0AAN9YYE1_9ORTH
MGPRAEQGILEPTSIATEKTPLLGADAPVVVVLPAWEALGPPSSLSRKELDEYVTAPFWARLRRTLFIGYWVALVVLFVASILLTPRCSGGKLPTTALPLISTTDPLPFPSTEIALSFSPSSRPT